MYTTELMEKIDFSINDKSNRYYNSEGSSVPRVTEILSSMMHSDSLMYWANSLGFRGLKYKDELNRAADIGTNAHFAIEMYLREKLKTDNIPFLGYLLWEQVLNEKGLYINPILTLLTYTPGLLMPGVFLLMIIIPFFSSKYLYLLLPSLISLHWLGLSVQC